jgi:large subunit ribosomal protein L10
MLLVSWVHIKEEKVANHKNKLMIKEIKDIFSNNKYIFMIDYKCLSVSKISELRNSLRTNNSEMKVMKNTLISIIIKELFPNISEQINKMLAGQTAVIFSDSEPVMPAKLLVKFVKENATVVIKGGILESTVIDGNEIKTLSALPSKEILIAKLLMLLNSPITGFVGALQDNIRKFVYVLNSIKNEKSA